MEALDESGDRGGRRDCQSRQHLGGQHIEVAAPQTLNPHAFPARHATSSTTSRPCSGLKKCDQWIGSGYLPRPCNCAIAGSSRTRFRRGRRSSPPDRRPRSETSDRFGRDASKYPRPREVARRPRGALAAGYCSTYCFPWEGVSADIKANVQPLLDDFSSFMLNSFRKMENSLVTQLLPGVRDGTGPSSFGIRGQRSQ